MPDISIERFRRVVAAAYRHLEARREEVNDLNVFPVADGDTGDNMTLTMQAVMAELDRLDGLAVDEIGRNEIVSAVARASLMGARGNSGVILSQIVRGAAEELVSRPGELVDPQLVAAALSRAVSAAYDSVQDPVEGTMLTVLREMANTISQRLAHTGRARLGPDASDEEQDELLAEVLEAAIEAGETAVERTPSQLDVLADAGVVDAGAYGLVLILAGIVAGLRGGDGALTDIPHHEPARVTRPHHEDSRFRYCVNFVVTGERLEAHSFVSPLEQLGDCVLVVGDEATLRVHVHTDDPAAARALFGGVGTVQLVDEADMREQITAREDRLALARTGVVAVASGDGMRRLYEGLGAYVVDGGPTLNPSTDELLAGLHAARAEEILVLPNSPNVFMAAEKAVELSEKPGWMLRCSSPQAGLVALVELDPDGSAEANADRLTEALGSIRSGAVAPAARDDPQGRFVRGDAVGFAGDAIVAWGGAGSTLAATIEALSEDAEIVTVIEGVGAPIRLDEIPAQVPERVAIELHHGGQPHYWWLLAAQ